MDLVGINRQNVGRIAERIVSNELEYHGFRVSDLNKEGISANADLLAVKDGKAWQIQVKGASEENGPWVHYGYCNEFAMSKQKRVFNSTDSFYKAEIVVLVSVKSPKQYTCVVLPVDVAERAAQLNLDYAYRTLTLKGAPKKPTGPVWVSIGYVPAKTRDASKRAMMIAEQAILNPYIDNWDFDHSGIQIAAQRE